MGDAPGGSAVKRFSAAALIVGVALLGACASDDGGDLGDRGDTPVQTASPSTGATPATTTTAVPTGSQVGVPGTDETNPAVSDEQPAVGETAIWSLDPATGLTPASQSFVALVMRTGCSSGRSAPVNGPQIDLSDDQVVVTFSVDPPAGMQTCPGNDVVPVVVELGEPIGDRPLLDGACQSGSVALATAYCPEGGDRRAATAFEWLGAAAPSVTAATRLAAYCEAAATLAGERPEAYVGSQQHRADIYRVGNVAPPELTAAFAAFNQFLLSGAIDPADPDSNLTENWPTEIRTAVDAIGAFNAATC